ncbi:Putative acyl-CoA dehydrogenase AidB [Aquicella siphonis]|uniref:Acyl-CoA dehydrogenase AidB n=1 Tax=Aquicella siphonis TaxID=254247 RepID=A0A5E4PGQ9_9COXI|nr:acyl-CoA dehydrogenase family protein [Aquicella siphonis]VVC75543.1 Putative acyl-CoA dehydrogenase AidB [Aquicella siphonis]
MNIKADNTGKGRQAISDWLMDCRKNVYAADRDYAHTIKHALPADFTRLHPELESFGLKVAAELEPLVTENNLSYNLPRIEHYDAAGNPHQRVIHHPSYREAGNIIYGTQMLKRMSRPGGMTECLAFLFLSSQAGEAGHNCPAACSAGIIRVLQKTPDFPGKQAYIERLTASSYDTNYTGAQFLTEIQGGSDVGLNAVEARRENENVWRIRGEKWFCSNAGADLIFLTARHDPGIPGTKGLGLFLVPALWNGEPNHYFIRRLKDKIGTRSMATGEVDFQDAYALTLGNVEDGFHLVMDNVLHLSRLFNTICVLGMARRAFFQACHYARRRIVFSKSVIAHPLAAENLARIKSENSAMLAAVFATARLQDEYDTGAASGENVKLLLRLLVNMQKYLSAQWSVQHIHHALDTLAGNGTIETFSAIPRLLRDSIVCENWEGTHNVLRAQILKDILKFDLDSLYISYMRAEMNKLKTLSEILQPVQDELARLETLIKTFREQETDLQQLQIRQLVDRMVILYCAVMLYHEAVDQQTREKSDSKMDCLRYFCLTRLGSQKASLDRGYLNLISRIMQTD